MNRIRATMWWTRRATPTGGTATLPAVVTLGVLAAAPRPAAAAIQTETDRALLKLARTEATAMGVDPCLAEVVLRIESGLKVDAVGHDENHRGHDRVPARVDFLASGRRFSGSRFEPTRKGRRGDDATNDDGIGPDATADLWAPPHYGIDWRFSHGFGLGQVTFGGRPGCRINGKSEPDAACEVGGDVVPGDYCRRDGRLLRGTWVSGLRRCLVVPELLSAEWGVRAMVARLRTFQHSVAAKLKKDSRAVRKACHSPRNLRGEGRRWTLIRGTIAAYAAGWSMGDTCRCTVDWRLRLVKRCHAGGLPWGLSAVRATLLRDAQRKGLVPRKPRHFLNGLQTSILRRPAAAAKPYYRVCDCSAVRVLGKSGPFRRVGYGSIRGWVPAGAISSRPHGRCHRAWSKVRP